MSRKRFANPPAGPALRALAEDAILENLERNGRWPEGATQVEPELRHEMIATAAYFIAEQRGFVPGHEQQDWYQAEAAIDKQLPRLLAQN
jgi:Protein of unknown function (DUF2934)